MLVTIASDDGGVLTPEGVVLCIGFSGGVSLLQREAICFGVFITILDLSQETC